MIKFVYMHLGFYFHYSCDGTAIGQTIFTYPYNSTRGTPQNIAPAVVNYWWYTFMYYDYPTNTCGVLLCNDYLQVSNSELCALNS